MQEIFISKDKENNKIITLVENGILLEYYNQKNDIKRIESNIYLGKVQNVLPGMQAAFIDIGEKKNTFIHLKDLLPKEDIKQKQIKNVGAEFHLCPLQKTNNIKDIIKPGMPVLVQVKRDSTNKKGAKVSTHISITSRFSVFMPNVDFITISQKIEDESEKQRLIKIYEKNLPNGSGAIIRTSANKKTEEQIINDIKSVSEKWKQINKQAEISKDFPKLLYQSDDLQKRFLNDIIDQNIEKITVDDKKTYEEVLDIIEEYKPKNNIQVILKGDEHILKTYDLNSQIEKISNRKIWLKCGGFITIDKTEALTAIDVNSGKYIGSKSLEQTVFIVNKEATIEIAKQLRLRDIGGIIVIDYIDMQDKANKEKIIKLLEENFKKDRSKTQVLEFTKLNLLEMTRKHMYNNENLGG